jgi:hypothetical protein
MGTQKRLQKKKRLKKHYREEKKKKKKGEDSPFERSNSNPHAFIHLFD